MDAAPCGQSLYRFFVEPRYRFENSQASARRTLCIVLVRLRPTEIGHHAIAEILGYVPAEAGYGLGCGTMIRSNDFPPFLGVESGRDLLVDCISSVRVQVLGLLS
jgi:hypothetical protein